MQTIFFFYGLAFIIMAIAIFSMPKKKDLFNLSDDLWLIAVFGLLHGLNEWIDLFILRGGSFNVEILKMIGALLLPFSFIFLVIFGVRVMFKDSCYLKYLRQLWILGVIPWLGAYFITNDFLIPGIVARYLLGITGTWLTSIGLFQVFLKSDKKLLPNIVSFSLFSSALTFLIYGILSGIIVPDADFLAASIFNYSNFKNSIGMPVQFCRMICALVLAISFFGMVGIYSRGENDHQLKYRGGIKRRVTFFVIGLVFFVVLFTVIGSSIWFYRFLSQGIKSKQKEITRTLSFAISQIIDREVNMLQAHLSSQVWKDAVIDSNFRYDGLSSKQIELELKAKDKQWTNLGSENQLVSSVLNNPMSERLKNLVKTDKVISSIFMLDRYGALVASSVMVDDYYEADEDWFHNVYSNGEGKVVIEDVGIDPCSNFLGIPMSVPIKDKDNNFIGMIKASINIEVLFSIIKNYKSGETGNASLVDGEGRIIYAKGVAPLTENLFDLTEMHKISNHETVVLERFDDNRGKKTITVVYRINDRYLLSNDIFWYVCVTQDRQEVFSSLMIFLFEILIFSIFLLFFAALAGVFVSNSLVRPIYKLNEVVERISRGEWDYPIEIRTGDEIEQFANLFRKLIYQVKEEQDQIIMANKQIEDFKNTLEIKVEERTKRLELMQEASLNVLEDFSEAKQALEKEKNELNLAKINLERSNQELEQFAYVASHDLQEPLRMVASYTQLLERRYNDLLDEKGRKYIAFAISGAERMQQLINDLLAFSRVGTKAKEFKEIDVNVVCDKVLANLEVAIRENNAQIISDKLPIILGDEVQLIQLFQNLIVNAIKFHGEKTPKIFIKVEDKEKEWIFSVVDNGIGFDEKYKDRIFIIFQRLHARDEYKGTGIGLSVCKKIVERHGGKIWVNSVIGIGTTFYFTIPKKRRKKIGEILIEDGLISLEELSREIEKQGE